MWGRRSPSQRFAMVAMHNYRGQWTSRKGCEPYLAAKAESAGYDRAAVLGGQGRARNLVQPLSRSAVPSSPIATLASVRSRVRTNAGNGPSRGPRPRSSASPSFPHVPAQLPEHGDSIVAVNDQVKGLAGCPYNHHSGGSVSAGRLLRSDSAQRDALLGARCDLAAGSRRSRRSAGMRSTAFSALSSFLTTCCR